MLWHFISPSFHRSDVYKRQVLLECMSNLTANEIYAPEGVGEDRCSEEILAGVKALENQCRHLIIVSNEVFEGGTNYDPSTVRYLDCLLYTSSR